MPKKTDTTTAAAAPARAGEIFARLRLRYPVLRSALDWDDAWQLLVATVLAAQCTDARVNTVTPTLFGRWPGPAELARADQADLEEVVRSTGFFRNKAKNLIGAAKAVMAEHGGEVPRTMEELTALPAWPARPPISCSPGPSASTRAWPWTPTSNAWPCAWA